MAATAKTAMQAKTSSTIRITRIIVISVAAIPGLRHDIVEYVHDL